MNPACINKADVFTATDPASHLEAAAICNTCPLLDSCAPGPEDKHCDGTYGANLWVDGRLTKYSPCRTCAAPTKSVYCSAKCRPPSALAAAQRLSAERAANRPTYSICAVCDGQMGYRKNKQYCSSKCRDAAKATAAGKTCVDCQKPISARATRCKPCGSTHGGWSTEPTKPKPRDIKQCAECTSAIGEDRSPGTKYCSDTCAATVRERQRKAISVAREVTSMKPCADCGRQVRRNSTRCKSCANTHRFREAREATRLISKESA